MSDERNLVQAVLKALEILELICRNRNCGVRELSEKAGINKSTVNRLVATLEKAGYVEQEKARGKYRASLRLFELGNEVIRHLDIYEQAYPIMQNLSEQTGETVNLAILDGNQVLYVMKIDSPHMLKSSAPIGSRSPVYCNASGKVILAYLSEGSRRSLLPAEFLPFTPNTIKDVAELETELSKVRANGYAVDNEEWSLNSRALAAPVWNYEPKIIAALTIAGPSVRMTAQRIEELAQILTKEAAALSAKLGYRGKSTGVVVHKSEN